MKINQIIESATTSANISTVPAGGGQVLSRTGVYGKNTKVGSLLKGKKTNKPFVNSISEGKVKELSMDLGTGKDGLSDAAFKKKYGKTKDEMRKAMKQKPEPVKEAELQEDDLIVIPGQGLKRRTGFVPNDPDRAEHEGETLKNSLHTIIRTATHLNRELSERDNFPEWVSEKIGTIKGMMVSVMDYLISDKEMNGKISANEMNGGVIAGGGVGESSQYGDHEISMAKSEMRSAAKSAKRIYHMLDNRDEIMAWQQSYITLASDYLNSVADSMEEEKREVSEGDVVDIAKVRGLMRQYETYVDQYEAARMANDVGKASALARKIRDTYNAIMSVPGGKQAVQRLAQPDDGSPDNVAESKKHKCPECGGEMVSEELMNEKKDACYYKVKSRYKVWPSAYASGALVKCRKKGASNWGNKSKK